jgi:hypothetical protein
VQKKEGMKKNFFFAQGEVRAPIRGRRATIGRWLAKTLSGCQIDSLRIFWFIFYFLILGVMKKFDGPGILGE